MIQNDCKCLNENITEIKKQSGKKITSKEITKIEFQYLSAQNVWRRKGRCASCNESCVRTLEKNREPLEEVTDDDGGGPVRS